MTLLSDRRVAAAAAEVDAAIKALSAALPLPGPDAGDAPFAYGRAKDAAEHLARALGTLGSHAQMVGALRRGAAGALR